VRRELRPLEELPAEGLAVVRASATADCTDVTDEGRHFPDIRAISEIRGFPAVRRELRPLEELPAEGLADANFAIGNGQFALCNRPVKCRAGLRGPGKLQIAN